MAFDDALFQLGMDLTRSSTAQKEDHYETVHAIAHDFEKSEHDDVEFTGTHLIIDLFNAKRLDELMHVERTLKRCVEMAGATLLHINLQRFPKNGGLSGVVVFDKGHANIRTWPDRDFAAIDLMFMARNSAQREALVQAIEQAFKPGAMETTVCRRAKDSRRTKVRAKPVVTESQPKVATRRLRRAA
ncbi:MAG: S-adenosylmethionine decarboxylase [Hyphomicrobiaceae bacterium]|nr:S-adenosylmethionine decarboxylase [Hyphomicrobiaceae bacterium]